MVVGLGPCGCRTRARAVVGCRASARAVIVGLGQW